MQARLFCRTGELAGANFVIREEATIGKNPDNAIQLRPGLISGKHARIFLDKKTGEYFVEDLGSKNGTRLDGSRLRGAEKLHRLHVITFAERFDFIFQLDEESSKTSAARAVPDSAPKGRQAESPPTVSRPKPPQEPQSPKTVLEQDAFAPPPLITPPGQPGRTVAGFEFGPTPDLPMPSTSPKPRQATILDEKAMATPQDVHPPPKPPGELPPVPGDVRKASGYVLDVNQGARKMSFILKEGENVIGRLPDCDIFIDDNSLSRKHAVILVKGDTLRLKDLGSKNYTMIGDSKVTEEVDVTIGMMISFGLVKGTLRQA